MLLLKADTPQQAIAAVVDYLGQRAEMHRHVAEHATKRRERELAVARRFALANAIEDLRAAVVVNASTTTDEVV